MNTTQRSTDNSLKVRIVIEVTVNRDLIANEYGIENTAAAIREDVKWTAYNAVTQAAYPLEGSIISSSLVNA